ncbi:hypothetical protein CDO73_07515 [Saccharibacillus sp. O23]|uniref:GrpB family protein n=1 Tax=Saccharibacillus sp. O23 TaxID=2009338 RepID=UPI000B4E4EA2|nr:GrpB family protein [Saccharibacillus sp. O23]OWR31242.1 hypothetical protein CDO73_07515 [Saccharibacillus sp. O23]
MQVRLSEYTPDWPRRFEEEAAYLRDVYGELILRFEHFGSTSVPGMKAKPVIDMMVIVRDITVVDDYNPRMIAAGYDAAGEWGIPGRRLLRKGGEDRTHHIHFYEDGNPQIDRHLVVRDYLRAHADEAEAYSAIKEELASVHLETSGYSLAKKAYVSDLEKRALAWQSAQQQSSE